MNNHIAQWSAAFCSNIRYLRKTHGLTQAQMADIMGVGISTVRLLENGTLPKRHILGIYEYVFLRRSLRNTTQSLR